MKHLSGADLYNYIALRRVEGGDIARVGDCWFDSGRRAPGYVAGTLVELLACGRVTLAEPDPTAMARAALTGAGTARYGQLQQTTLQVPAPSSAPPAGEPVRMTPTRTAARS